MFQNVCFVSRTDVSGTGGYGVSLLAFELVDCAVGILAAVDPEMLAPVHSPSKVHTDGLAGHAVPLLGTGSHSLRTVSLVLCIYRCLLYMGSKSPLRFMHLVVNTMAPDNCTSWNSIFFTFSADLNSRVFTDWALSISNSSVRIKVSMNIQGRLPVSAAQVPRECSSMMSSD